MIFSTDARYVSIWIFMSIHLILIMSEDTQQREEMNTINKHTELRCSGVLSPTAIVNSKLCFSKGKRLVLKLSAFTFDPRTFCPVWNPH